MYQMTEPCTKIIKHGLQSLFLSQFPDIFTDNLKIVRSHIPVAKTSARIDIHKYKSTPPTTEVVNPQRGKR